MSNFLWHLFHNPMRDNLWSFLALLLILVAAFGVAWWAAGRSDGDCHE